MTLAAVSRPHPHIAADPSNATPVPHTRYRHVEADGVRVFYREAGRADAPVLLLLHGFPSSSHMYRELIAQLADCYRLIAPDLPGFGLTEVPESRNYFYTFDALANTLQAFIDALQLKRYAMYVFDYGAPVGFRLALKHPERITALISQNGNAYIEGLSAAWNPIQAYWHDPSAENRDALRGFLSLDAIRWQYEHGTPDPSLIAPEAYYLDAQQIARPGNDEIQLQLFKDYASNIELYPRFQAWFGTSHVPTLVIWGEHDPFFIPAGAQAYTRDNPNATVELLNTGHFALETHAQHIAQRIAEVLGSAII